MRNAMNAETKSGVPVCTVTMMNVNRPHTGSHPINSCSQTTRRDMREGYYLGATAATRFASMLSTPSVHVFPSSVERSWRNLNDVGVMS